MGQIQRVKKISILLIIVEKTTHTMRAKNACKDRLKIEKSFEMSGRIKIKGISAVRMWPESCSGSSDCSNIIGIIGILYVVRYSVFKVFLCCVG